MDCTRCGEPRRRRSTGARRTCVPCSCCWATLLWSTVPSEYRWTTRWRSPNRRRSDRSALRCARSSNATAPARRRGSPRRRLRAASWHGRELSSPTTKRHSPPAAWGVPVAASPAPSLTARARDSGHDRAGSTSLCHRPPRTGEDRSHAPPAPSMANIHERTGRGLHDAADERHVHPSFEPNWSLSLRVYRYGAR
jgi:hypothetical protein